MYEVLPLPRQAFVPLRWCYYWM